MMSVCPSLKISVTTEPMGFYSLGSIPTGPVVVLGYFLGSGTPTPLHFFLNLMFVAPDVLNF